MVGYAFAPLTVPTSSPKLPGTGPPAISAVPLDGTCVIWDGTPAALKGIGENKDTSGTERSRW